LARYADEVQWEELKNLQVIVEFERRLQGCFRDYFGNTQQYNACLNDGWVALADVIRAVRVTILECRTGARQALWNVDVRSDNGNQAFSERLRRKLAPDGPVDVETILRLLESVSRVAVRDLNEQFVTLRDLLRKDPPTGRDAGVRPQG
jgi:hypothetical protein